MMGNRKSGPVKPSDSTPRQSTSVKNQGRRLILNKENHPASRKKKSGKPKPNYFELYDLAPVSHFTLNQKGIIKEVNLAGARLLDVKKSLLLNKPFHRFALPEFRDVFRSHFEKVFSTCTKQTCELKLMKKDGAPLYVLLESIAMTDEKGNLTLCLCAVSDITGRKTAEEELMRHRLHLEEIVEERTAEMKKEITRRMQAEKELRHFASFPRLNPNPVLEVDSSGEIIFRNNATIKTLKKLNLTDANVFLPDDINDILKDLNQKNEKQFYREILIKGKLFGEVLYIAPQFNAIRIYAIDITERKLAEELLQISLEKSRQRHLEISALLEGSRAVLKYQDFKSAAQLIFNSCKNLIGATAGYIALLSKDGKENEVVFLDSGGLDCTVDRNLPMPIRGLRAEVYHNNKAVYHNDFFNSEWMKFMPEGHVRLDNVLFAPMIIEGKVIGLLGIANKPGGFNENDARMATAFAELASIALFQKRAEEALRSSEARYRSYIEVTEQLGWTTNADGEVVEDIPSWRKFTGQSEEEIKGLGWSKALHPDDFEHTALVWRNAVAIKNTYEVEYRIRRYDGVYRHFLARSMPVFKDNGDIQEWVGSCIDITEHKAIEKALRESEEDLNRAQAVANTGSWRLDVQRNVLIWSNENWRIFGLPKGTPLTYETFLSNVHPDDREYVNRKWMAALRGEHYDIEHRIVIGDTVKWVRERAELEFDGEGVLLGGFGTTQDITGQKQAEMALKRSKERVDLLSQTASNLLATSNPQELISSLCDKVMKYLDCQVFFNFLVDEKENRLRLNAYAGIPDETAKGIEWLDYGVAVSGAVARVGERIIAENIPETIDSRTDLVRSFGIKAYACHPLIALRRVIGTLSFGTRSRSKFTDDELDMMKTVADQVSIAMQRMQFLQELENKVQERTAKLSIANETIQLERNRLKSILDTMPDGIFIVNRQHEIQYANPALEKAFGPVESRKCHDYFHGLSDVCPMCRKSDVIAGKISYREWHNEKTGKTYDLFGAPFINEDGSISKLEIFHDITKRKKAEKALNDERQRLFSLMEQLPAYVCLLTQYYTFAYVNREFKRRFGDPGDRYCHEFLFNLQTPCDDCQTFRVFTEHKAQQWEWTGPDGNTYAIYDYPFTDIDGSPLILELGLDITERKKAEEELKKSREQLRNLYTNLQSAREEERTRIAREIHDEFGTILTALKIDLSWLERKLPEDQSIIERTKKDIDLINSAIKTVQRISSELRPGILDHLGLSAAVEWQVKEFGNRTGVKWDISIDIEKVKHERDLSTAIFRILQETLTNIARHAEATKVSVCLNERDSLLVLEVKDNGKGVTEEQISDPHSFGLMGIRERIQYWGGDVEIQGIPDKGTTVTISIPLENKEALNDKDTHR